MNDAPSSQPRHRLYGRAAGKPLSKRQQALIDDVLPTLGDPGNGAGRSCSPSPCSSRQHAKSGSRSALAAGNIWPGRPRSHPDVGIIGAEPFIDGVAKLLTALEEGGIATCLSAAATPAISWRKFADASIDRVFILFPDPWPKTRHRKRRLVQPDFVAELARVHEARRASCASPPTGRTTPTARLKPVIQRWPVRPGRPARADDWRVPPADHVTTRYQEKRLGDCAPVFLDFVRV
jgi:tRNA (guanine-N7-)-methyltransferase